MPVPEISLTMREGEALPDHLLGPDAARGYALWAFIAASLGEVAAPSPFWVYLAFFAMTILLATTAMTESYKRLLGTSWLRIALSTALLLVIAAWVDLHLRARLPFASAEALPAILMMSLLATACYRLPSIALAISATAVLGIGLALSTLGELHYPLYFPYPGAYETFPTKEIAQQWLVAGWVPLLPYFFFSLFGILLLRLIAFHPAHIFRAPPASRLALLLIVAGGIWASVTPEPDILPLQPAALFMPPVPALFMLAAGAFILIGMVGELATFLSLNRIWEVTGRYARILLTLHTLLMHAFLIAYLRENPALHWYVFAAELFGLGIVAFISDYICFAYRELRIRAGSLTR